MVDYKRQAIEARGCPACGAHPAQRCWSQHLREPMVNEVHRERMRKA